jgi:hypothetical protein
MSKFNQKNGVFAAIEAVLSEAGKGIDGKVELTKDERHAVVQMVTTGLFAGEIEMKDEARAKYDTEEKMRGYAGGLVNNWLRKDDRLNGGVDYVPKNPGSRLGSGDAVVKELKKLRSTLTDASEIQAVEAEIEKRMQAIQAEKAKKVEINDALIPDDLKHLLAK